MTRNSASLHLSQCKYNLDLLHEIGMLNSSPMPTLMTHSSRLSSSEGTKLNPKDTPVEPSGVQALKNPNPLKDVEGLVVFVVAELS